MYHYQEVVPAGTLASVAIDGGGTVEVCIKRLSQPEGDEQALAGRVVWSGVITAVQPRIRLTRSFDERSHSCLGYLLGIKGTIDGADREFRVGMGPEVHTEHQFRIGDSIEGMGYRVRDPHLEISDIYRLSKLKLLRRGEASDSGPPWHGIASPLPIFRERGHWRLATATYESKCQSCIWGSAMPVEIIVDHWNPQRRRYRTETFCYGPLSCPLYTSGPARKVPGRNGMIHEEPDWLDRDLTSHRGPDD